MKKLKDIASQIKDDILTEGVLSDWGDNNTPAALKKEKEIKNKKVKPEDAITDLDLNTLNRNQTVKEYRYGPLNPDDEKGSAKFWEDKAKMWDTTVEAAKQSRCGNCGAFDQKKSTLAKIDKAIGPILDGISDMIGGVGKIAGSVFSAIDTILGFESYLCLPKECPEVNAITLDPSKLVPIKSVKDKFDGFNESIKKIDKDGDGSFADDAKEGINNYIGDFSVFGTKLGDMPEADSSDEYKELNTMVDAVCNANSLRCGPPTIEIFGGGGAGAIASAVVDELGHVIAASLEDGGSGYTSPPFVAILDSCDIGQGASAYSELNDDGEIERIVIVNTGNGYNNQPISGGGIASDYIVCLDGFEIISTGIGYAPTDEITITPNIPNLEVSVQMNEEGQIVQMQVLNSV